MGEDQEFINHIEENERFEDVEKFIREDMDFFNRLKLIRGFKLDKYSFPTFCREYAEYVNDEKSLMKEVFREAFNHRVGFLEERDKFKEISQDDPLYSHLWGKADGMFLYFSLGYKHALQSTITVSLYAQKLAEHMQYIYANEGKLAVKDRVAVANAVEMIEKAHKKLEAIVNYNDQEPKLATSNIP